MFIIINICPRYICSVYKKLPKWPYHYILHEQWMRVPVGPYLYQQWEFIASLLNFNHLGNVELYFMMILICFSRWQVTLAIFSYAYWPMMYPSLWTTGSNPCPLPQGGKKGCLFIIELEDIKITYSRYKSDICILNIFFQVCNLPIHFLIGLQWHAS